MHLPETFPELQLLDKQLYAFLNGRLGLTQDPRKQLGVHQVVKALQLVRDVDASRLISEWTVSATAGAAGADLEDGPAPPAGTYHLVHAVSLSHNDGAVNQDLRLTIRDTSASQDVIFAATNGAVNVDWRLLATRNLIIPAGNLIRGTSDNITAGSVLTLVIAYQEITVGDYIVMP